MKLQTNKLSSAVRTALTLGAVLAVGASGTAFAQDTAQNSNDTTELQAVVVTGSHIRRVDMETANPVISVNQETIKATGALTLGELTQQLPAMTGGQVNPQVNNGGGDGSSTVSLRGLGPNRTLILVDGHRVLRGDVNSIPASMIQRIEVLTSGAAAVYGSDAIGGVVNFITKKHFDGIQLTANYGESSREDGQSQGYTLTLGHSTDKAGFIAGIGYSKIDGVEAGARDFSENAVSIDGQPAETYVGGSSNSPYGHIQIPFDDPDTKKVEGGPLAGQLAAAYPGCESGYLARNPGASGMNAFTDYHCYMNSGANSDKYNYATVNLIMTPQQRTNGFVLSHYNINDHVQLYFNAYFNKTRSNFQLAPSVYSSRSVTIDKDNYFNPFGAEYSLDSFGFNGRLEGSGNRFADYSNTLFQGSVGLKGDFSLSDRRWTWDVGMDYGHNTRVLTTGGLPNLNMLYTGPSHMTANGIACGTAANPVDCPANAIATFNPFNLQSADSVAALQKAAVPALTNAYSQMQVFHANASGGLFDLPAGTVQLAVGASYRKNHAVTRVDPVLQLNDRFTCVLGSQCAAGLRGGYNVKAAYAEMFVPVLRGIPGIQALNVTIGDRYSKFSTVGSNNSTEFKVEWRPFSDLLVRGTVAEVFRAPNIGELYGAPGSDAPKMNFDPCDGYTGNPVNPACVNVPTDGSFVNKFVDQNLQANAITSGAVYAGFPIKPEQGKSFDFGLVYSPSWLSGFSGSVDFWHMYLKNIITTVGLQSLVNLCSAGQTVYCQYIHRTASGPNQGQITAETLEPTGNLGRLDVSGVDTTLTYKLNTQSLGRFRFVVNATYLKYYDQQSAPGTAANVTYHDAGHFLSYGSPQAAACPGAPVCLFPRIRSNANVHWQKGNWHASWHIRFIGDYRMGSPAPSQDVHPVGSDFNGVYFDYGSTVYHDLTVGYDIQPWHTRIDVGVRNAFDKQPHVMWANNTLNADTAPSQFDLMGRYWWGRLTFTF